VLTTNRPEILEPALAARPGRVDLAIELPLPDVKHRRRLLELYAKGLDVRNVDLASVVARTEGTSPAYIKELLRRAALLAATEVSGHVVTGAHLDVALDELSEGGRLAQRLLGFQSGQEMSTDTQPPGFPSGWPGRMA
jgi:ATP-dependent 26S proteasome regulatory subunit